MILYKGSASGTPVYCTPCGIDLRGLTEGTDYAGYASSAHTTGASVEVWHSGESDELTCVAFDMLTPDGLAAVGETAGATDLVPQMQIILTDDGYVQSLPFETVTGAEPADYAVHSRDWYYKKKDQISAGDDTETLYRDLTAATEAWSSPRYKNTDYAQIFWTGSGGTFGVGQYIIRDTYNDYYCIASAGARCGKAPSGYVCYPTAVGDWEPRYRGIASARMFDTIFHTTGRRLPSSWMQSVSKYAEVTVRTRIVLCSFVYQDKEYIGCAVLAYAVDDTLLHCGCWGISAAWWQSPGSKYEYTVNPDGTVKKAVNPNYRLSQDRWVQKGLPGAGVNRLVTGANYISVDPLTNIPYGYATYSLVRSDFNTCIREWTNKLSSYLGSMGGWADRVSNAASYIASGVQTLVSNPIESILKVHTLPLTAAEIATLASSWTTLPYVRSGGIDSPVSTVGTLLDNDARIVSVECVSNQKCGRLYNWWYDWTHTSVSIFVPFVGEIPLTVDDVLDRRIYVRYRIDVMTGDLIVTVANEYGNIKTASGNCSIPVVCSSSATLQERALHSIAGAVQSGMQIAASASIGNAPGVISGLAGAAQSLTQSMQQHVAYSSVGGDGGLFSGLYEPVLIIRRPIPATGDVGSVSGYMSGTVGTVEQALVEDETSYISVIDADLSGVDATAEEKQMIMTYLKGGVYL